MYAVKAPCGNQLLFPSDPMMYERWLQAEELITFVTSLPRYDCFHHMLSKIQIVVRLGMIARRACCLARVDNNTAGSREAAAEPQEGLVGSARIGTAAQVQSRTGTAALVGTAGSDTGCLLAVAGTQEPQ